jgi:hypothetical protein
MPLARAALRAALSVGATAAACSSAGNQLQGSVSEVTSLAFSQVVVIDSAATKTSPPQLVVSYRAYDDAGAFSVPFELQVNLTALPPLTAGSPPIDLGVLVPPDGGVPIALADRQVSASDTRQFPAIDRGPSASGTGSRSHLWIDQDIVVGQQGSGHFFLVFAFQSDSSIGQGHTVEGHFQAVVVANK